MKSLDRKLASILAGRYTPDDFILADAKDPDMAKGVTPAGAPRDAQGRAGPGFKTRRAFLDDMAAVVKQGEVDILLASASNGERLGREIQLAESPLDIVALMRPVIRGELSPLEAVRAYHAALGRKAIAPDRSLEADAVVTESALKLGERGAR